MQQFIREFKVPVNVTAAGLVVAGVLAAAPVLMAESDSEILTRSNEAEIQKLSTTLAQQTADLQQAVDQQASLQLASLDRLENQVNILNKATGRLNQKQATMIGPVSDTIADFNSLKTNASTRLTNLEKAVSRMHQRQQQMAQSTMSTAAPAGLDDTSALRITNLEKAVKQLHLSMQRSNNNEPTPAAAINTTANTTPVTTNSTTSNTTPVASNTTVENIPDDTSAELILDTNSRMAALEERIARLQQPRRNATFDRTQSGISRAGSDLRLARLERQLIRMEARLDVYEGNNGRQDRVREDQLVDQLIEIRSYIDSLLYEVNP